MKDQDGNINDLMSALDQWGKNLIKPCLLVDGIIDEVDQEAFTCSIRVGDALFNKVPIKVVINAQSSFIEIPKQGTDCLMRFKDNNIQCPQLVAVHECERILIKVGASVLSITDGLFEFNDGDNNGMVKTTELKTQLDKCTARIDAIFDIISNTIQGCTLQPNPAWKAAIDPTITLINAQKEAYTNIEDTKVTH